MSRMPRLLPLVAVAIVGVLAVNALAGARSLPELISGARAFAEDVGGRAPAAKTAASKAAPAPAVAPKAASPLPPGGLALAAPPPVATAAPTTQCPVDVEFARAAGLTPAQVQVLQSLGARRGQLDQREQDLDIQLQLLAAAEAKLDARIATLNGLKTDLTGLLGQADLKKQAEIANMVKIYETMNAKKAAEVMAVLDDSVRVPLAVQMKPLKLAPILAAMRPADAKRLTELISRRFEAQAIEAGRQATAATPAPAPAAAAAAAPPPGPAQKTAAVTPPRPPTAKAAATPPRTARPNPPAAAASAPSPAPETTPQPAAPTPPAAQPAAAPAAAAPPPAAAAPPVAAPPPATVG